MFWAGFKSKGGVMTSTTAKIVWSITIGLAIFIAGAIVDAFITVWIFKKYGGCPIHKAK